MTVHCIFIVDVGHIGFGCRKSCHFGCHFGNHTLQESADIFKKGIGTHFSLMFHVVNSIIKKVGTKLSRIPWTLH